MPRVYIFCTTESMLHGGMFETLLDAPDVEAVGAAVFPGVAGESGIAATMRKILALDGWPGLFRLGVTFAAFRLAALAGRPGHWGRIEKLFRSRHVPLDHFDSPNDPRCVDHVRSLNVDFLLNNQPRILRPEILAAPVKACLNRHTSALPAYRGLEPVFHALLHGETRIGVSVHSMTPTIDGGQVYAQGFVPARGSVLDCYRAAFAISAGLFLEAMENFSRGRVLLDAESTDLPLHRRPTAEEIRRFKDKGLHYV